MIVTDMSSSLAVHLQDVAALPRAQERAVSRFLKTFSVSTSTPAFSSSTSCLFSPIVPASSHFSSFFIICSLLGAAVADAASRPLHWVYDMTLMEELMKVGMGRTVGKNLNMFPCLKSVIRRDDALFRMAKIQSSGQRVCLPSTPCPPEPGAATTTSSWPAYRSTNSTWLFCFWLWCLNLNL